MTADSFGMRAASIAAASGVGAVPDVAVAGP
jgi:hypothetical protein